MSVKLSREHFENLESWLTLNLDSHIAHKDTSSSDKDLLQEIKNQLGRSIFILYTSCNSDPESIHTKDSIRFYMSIVSSMATGIIIGKEMKKIEDKTEGSEDFIMESLKMIMNPEKYESINNQVREVSLKVEEIIGPSIRWWLANELHLNMEEDLRDFFLEAFREKGDKS